MFPVDGHTSPALLSIIWILHDKVTSKVFNTFSLLGDGVINHPQRSAESQVEILPVPGLREETSWGWNRNLIIRKQRFNMIKYDQKEISLVDCGLRIKEKCFVIDIFKTLTKIPKYF